MNKSTNYYRKCAFCPHQNLQNRCCCKKQINSIKTKRAKSIKTKNSSNNQIQNISSIGYVNTYLKSQNGKGNESYYNQVNIPTLMAQNSILKSENGNLKKQLLNVSSFNLNSHDRASDHYNNYQNVQNSATLNNYTKNTVQQQNLMDKLYHSNKNLHQAILKMQTLSKSNHCLNQEIITLNLKIKSLELELLAKNKQNQNFNKNLKQNNSQIQEKCKYLQKSNLELKKQLDIFIKKSQKSLQNELPNMSHEWLTQTSNKVKMIQKGLTKLQQTQNITTNTDEQDIVNQNQTRRIKQQLIFTISNTQSQVKKIYSSSFSLVSSNANIMNLVKLLIQNIASFAISSQMNIQSQLIRKVSTFEKKVDYLMGRLQNLVLSVKNRQLRKRSTSRSRISGKRNLLSKQQNTLSRNSIASKENINTSNSVNLIRSRPKSQFNY